MKEEGEGDYENCRLCPRNCGVNRRRGSLGFCRQGPEIRLAWAGLHRGEEPPLSGGRGAGGVFFSGCTLGCVFCQNRQLSREALGREVEARDLARIFLDLQDRGAQNLDLVTGSPFIPGILAALGLARRGGLRIPLVWNTSGYESLRGVSLLAPVVDLWLPDLKTLNPALARRYLGAEDYPQAAKEALEAMTASPARGIPWQEEGEDRRLRMILRHLILPGQPESTREVLEFYAAFRREGIVLSLMTQYQPRLGSSPEGESTSPSRDGLPEELRRPLTGAEARRARRCLENLGIDEGFIQPPPGLGEDGVWQPDFHRRNPFPGDFSQTLWFWKDPPSE